MTSEEWGSVEPKITFLDGDRVGFTRPEYVREYAVDVVNLSGATVKVFASESPVLEYRVRLVESSDPAPTTLSATEALRLPSDDGARVLLATPVGEGDRRIWVDTVDADEELEQRPELELELYVYLPVGLRVNIRGQGQNRFFLEGVHHAAIVTAGEPSEKSFVSLVNSTCVVAAETYLPGCRPGMRYRTDAKGFFRARNGTVVTMWDRTLSYPTWDLDGVSLRNGASRGKILDQNSDVEMRTTQSRVESLELEDIDDLRMHFPSTELRAAEPSDRNKGPERRRSRYDLGDTTFDL